MKKAILQVADTGPLESLVVMLRSIGYECFLPGERLKKALRDCGCCTVLDIDSLMRGMGYDMPFPDVRGRCTLQTATPEDMKTADLYVDIKAHCNGPCVWTQWPNLQKRTLWYRINGAKPEHVPGCGDEVNLNCPILTPNMWYSFNSRCPWCGAMSKDLQHLSRTRDSSNPCSCNVDLEPTGWAGRAYTCWPPFYRFNEYLDKHGRVKIGTSRNVAPPLCLIHRVEGWGYKALLHNASLMGIKVYGVGSPDGLLQHSDIPALLSHSLAMVHFKSNDAPGYALYEAMAAGCPVICTRRLIWRCQMYDLFIPDMTCLVFDRETHDGLSTEDIYACTAEIKKHLDALADPEYNQRIGMAGHNRLKQVMWSANRSSDVGSLRDFMDRNFPA